MVGIVESIEEVFVEGMDILQAWETIEDGLELLAKRLGSKFNLASVETWVAQRQSELTNKRSIGYHLLFC